MIAGCPKCGARYRIDTGKLRAEGARLRCSRCEAVFRVLPPQAASAPGARSEPPASEGQKTSAPAARSAPPAGAGDKAKAPGARDEPPAGGVGEASAPAQSAPQASRAPQAPAGAPAASAEPRRPTAIPLAGRAPVEAPPPDPERLVLVAHPEVTAAKAITEAVASWGLEPRMVHDGVEAILNVQRLLPRVVVLDAALPKMFGFQVCELMKRNEQLRAIRVVLVGAIHDRDRYRRPPEELYGADVYVERHELPAALSQIFASFGLPVAGAAPAPSAAAPPAAAAAAPPPSDDPQVAEAERLARIIVSDVILYNQEKFDAAVRAGDVVEALSAELEEGYALFAQRVNTGACDPREFIQRELLRVARSRGMS